MSFIKAEWRRLILANYEVADSVLAPYLPKNTVLDKWNGRTYVSLVGFMFKNVKVMGLKIPFHVNFPEVNLRFYVKHFEGGEWRRGVVFIKEIVSKPAITFVANTLYKEHYVTHPMRYSWEEKENMALTQYEWKLKEEWQSLQVETAKTTHDILADSETEFITEHYWGYTKVNKNTTFEYEVTHPRWAAYKVLNYDIKVDFEKAYGSSFKILNQLKPTSVMLAEGSLITVENKRKL